MSTKARSYRVPRRINRRNPEPVVRLGNCQMCALSGEIGQRCATGCRDGGDLSSEVDGSPVSNDQTTSHARCIYKAMLMPDQTTVVSAPWYEGAITSTGVEGQAIGTAWLSTRTPTFVLERGCIHHRTIMSWAESAGIDFPTGNEIEDMTDSEVNENA
jgi:hypothetical protein